jgi:hypothetical protein
MTFRVQVGKLRASVNAIVITFDQHSSSAESAENGAMNPAGAYHANGLPFHTPYLQCASGKTIDMDQGVSG